MERYDVVVVGAGLSGLVAAHRLSGSHSVTVLEGAERIGGRVVNLRLDDETVVEGGGQWIGPGQTRVAALARELGVGTFRTYDRGRHVMILDGERRTYRGSVPTAFPHVTLEFGRVAARLQLMSRHVDAARPWTAKGAADLDRATFGEFLDEHCHSASTRLLFTALSGLTFGGDPGGLSLLGVLAHIRSAGGLIRLIAVRGGAQERRFTGGSGRLIEELAARLGPRIATGQPVTRIAWSDEGAEVNGIEARHVVVATSPPDRARITFDPPLPAGLQALHAGSDAFSGLKIHAVYPTPFWRDEGMSGQALGDLGPVPVLFDNSPPDGRVGVLTGFMAGVSTPDPITPTPAQLADPGERRSAVLTCIDQYIGGAEPADYLEKDWRSEPFIAGCIPALPPGLLTAHGRHQTPSTGAIVWAGAEQAHVWNGYLDGAVRSGEAAAAQVTTSRS